MRYKKLPGLFHYLVVCVVGFLVSLAYSRGYEGDEGDEETIKAKSFISFGSEQFSSKRLEAPMSRKTRRSSAAVKSLKFAGYPATSSPEDSSIGSTQDPVEPDRKVHYKTVGETKLHLHVFEPEGLKTSDPRAAIVFFFGGGWAGGDPRQFYEQAQVLSKLGMVAFSAEYRVRSRNNTTPLECVKDAKSAIRWVRAHAAQLGVDPDRIVASGGSAGGHIAACTGVVEGHEETGEDLQVSSVPNLMILFNPVLDTTKGTGFGSDRFAPELQSGLSPCHQIRGGIAPTIIYHGTADETVPFEQAERFTRLMKEVGNECVLVPFAEKGHGFFNGTLFRPKNDAADFEMTMKRSVEFLTEHGYLPLDQ